MPWELTLDACLLSSLIDLYHLSPLAVTVPFALAGICLAALPCAMDLIVKDLHSTVLRQSLQSFLEPLQNHSQMNVHPYRLQFYLTRRLLRQQVGEDGGEWCRVEPPNLVIKLRIIINLILMRIRLTHPKDPRKSVEPNVLSCKRTGKTCSVLEYKGSLPSSFQSDSQATVAIHFAFLMYSLRAIFAS